MKDNKMYNDETTANLSGHYEEVLKQIGEDPTREGLLKTPERMAKAMQFLAGAVLGVSRQPYGVLFRALVRPRLAPATEFEDVRPPRFAQAVGLVFAVVALVGAAAGLPVLYYAAVGMALAAAFLNAAFNFCLGCEFYLLIARARGGRAAG